MFIKNPVVITSLSQSSHPVKPYWQRVRPKPTSWLRSITKLICSTNPKHYPPWHFLYFFPLPHGHLSLRAIFLPWIASSNVRCSNPSLAQSAQVHAAPCPSYQLVRSFPITMIYTSSIRWYSKLRFPSINWEPQQSKGYAPQDPSLSSIF